MADESLEYALVNASFDAFIGFLFDHEIPPERVDPWYFGANAAFDAGQLVDHYTRLFTDPAFLRDRYPRDQLEQGFWAVLSSTLDCSAYHLIWDGDVSLGAREACVRSMFHVFERFFSVDALDTSAFMWWDSLAYDWHCGIRLRSNGGEDESMQDVMFETLERVLALPAVACQRAALHGLGHLHHPATPALIEHYLSGNVHPGLRDYAHAAARFEVL